MRQEQSDTSAESADSTAPVPTYKTPTMSLAAYLVMKGLVIKKARRKQRRDQNGPEYEFEFEDPHDLGSELAKQFISSEASQFDDALRKVRMLLRS